MHLKNYTTIQELFPTESDFRTRYEILTNEIGMCVRKLTEKSGLIFFTLLDRLQYLKNSASISQDQYRFLVNFFHNSLEDTDLFADQEKSYTIELGLEILGNFYAQLEGGVENQKNLNKTDSLISQEGKQWKEIRAKVISIKDNEIEINILDQEEFSIHVLFSQIDKIFEIQIKKIAKIVKGYIPVWLHQLKNENQIWSFDSIILFPDYLIDVTSVSECYDPKGNSVIRQFVNLFNRRTSSKSILIGTAVNEFLDELILNPLIEYKSLIRQVFQKYAVPITALNDEDAKEFLAQTEFHFEHLKEIINGKFSLQIHDYKKCLLEPSFYSVQYGIQGRLDLLYQNQLSNHVIELKSGKPYQVNSEGISASHHAQACLYLMILESVFGEDYVNRASILYSVLSKDQLRHAIDQKSLRKRLIEVRNSILMIHIHLSYSSPYNITLFDLIQESSFLNTNTFTKRDGNQWLLAWNSLSDIDKKYIRHYSYFISREQLISRCGAEGSFQGLASMWLISLHEKESQYTILTNLILKEVIRVSDDTPVIILQSTKENFVISQFRIGDTLILYPQTIDGQGMLKSIVYKCTLIQNSNNQFHVRLRGRQFSEKDQISFQLWCLESDTLDRPFLYQYSNLFEWMSSSSQYRNRMLGMFGQNVQQMEEPKDEDNDELCSRILSADDFFLLWGPPGSGKTSVIIHKLIELLMSSTHESVLLLAYTNKAVDEICHVLEKIELAKNFLRIGSRYGTSSQFHSYLLDNKIREFSTRKQLKELLKSTRIVTATIASIQGKPELFQLKKFETVIIDEASQILEPNLMGLLSRFNKFILIGDHLQLPAVSAQVDSDCEIKDAELKELGFYRTNESLFERLYRQCINKKQYKHFGMLKYQGRMHSDIMNFPSEHFYNNKLEILKSASDSRQSTSLDNLYKEIPENEISKQLVSNRTLFLNSDVKNLSVSFKKNTHEAKLIVKLIQGIKELYLLNNKEWNLMTCGIITPFRIQISTITDELKNTGLADLPITIDTVERYQGGARDIIIISTCISLPQQLEQISSLNQNGIDRKLNVALTRAKEQIILVGNRTALSDSPIYAKLIDTYKHLKIE